jgi:hypothetical protein
MSETTAQIIARLRQTLQSGVTSDSRDGASTTIDLQVIKEQLRELEEQTGTRRRRSPIINVVMSRR